jgi:DNA-binding transcriptional ArsR family regulator
MQKNTLFQNMTEADLDSIATRSLALSEVSRLKLIMAAGDGEKNVSQLIAVTGLSQANVSKHLKILTDSGVLARRKQGIYVFYSTTDSSIFKLCEVGKASLRKALGRS